jgi:hypothetical protein
MAGDFMTKTLSGRGLTAAGVLSLFVSYGRPLGKYIERPLWLGNEFFLQKNIMLTAFRNARPHCRLMPLQA